MPAAVMASLAGSMLLPQAAAAAAPAERAAQAGLSQTRRQT
jgi:hypothetical protein